MKRKSTRAEVAEARVAELEAERDASTPHRNRDYSTNPITDERLAQMCDETRWWKSDGDEIYRAVHELRDLRAKAAEQATDKRTKDSIIRALGMNATDLETLSWEDVRLRVERLHQRSGKQATAIARLTNALHPAIAELARLREVHLPRFEDCIGEPDKEIMDRGVAALSKQESGK